MPTCDMCGKEMDRLLKAKVEGTVLEVCDRCVRFGEVIKRQEIRVKDFSRREHVPMPKRKEVLQIITDDYAEKIRTARERMGLKQEEFAKKLNEKESIMQKIESGQFKPSISTARKLERLLNIRLIEDYSEGEGGEIPVANKKKGDDSFTLGDFIKKR